MYTRRYFAGLILPLLVLGCSPAPERSFERGIQLFQAREYAAAATALEKSIVSAPPTAQALNLIGVCRLQTGKPEAALQRFRAALQLDPQHLAARHNLALAQLEVGQTEEAAKGLQQLAQLTGVPSDLNLTLATAYNNLAVAAARLRDTRRAEHYFELAIRADPGSVAVRNLAALRTPASIPTPRTEKPPANPPPAVAMLQPAVSPPPATNLAAITPPVPPLPPPPPPTTRTSVTTVATATTPARTSPATPAAKSGAGIKRRTPVTATTLVPGNREEARKYFTEGVKLQQQSKLPNAIAYYTKAVALDPAYAQAYYNLAIAYSGNRQFDLALTNYELALATDPKFTDARHNYAILLQNQGYSFDAAEQFEKILEVNPNDAVVRLALAALYARDRELRPKARQHYEAYLRLVPNSPQAREIRAWLEQNR